MFVTRHTHVVDAVLADKLWQLYDVAYQGLSEQAVTREMLYRSEFDETIADPTNRLWVLWDDNMPIGMSLVATEIGSTRYLSRAYFEHHYPDHMRRGAVHYIMWLVVHPAHVAKGAIIRPHRSDRRTDALMAHAIALDPKLKVVCDDLPPFENLEAVFVRVVHAPACERPPMRRAALDLKRVSTPLQQVSKILSLRLNVRPRLRVDVRIPNVLREHALDALAQLET